MEIEMVVLVKNLVEGAYHIAGIEKCYKYILKIF